MTARKLLICVLASACGSEKDFVRDDAAAMAEDDSGMGPITMTRVTGSLYGSSFVLQYAAARRGTTSDPRHWLCVADIQLTYDQCEQTGGPDRTMFLGPFVYDSNGDPEWAFPQVWLYRVGPSPLSKYASSGTLEILADDAAANELELTLSVDFGETPVTSGSVRIAP